VSLHLKANESRGTGQAGDPEGGAAPAGSPEG